MTPLVALMICLMGFAALQLGDLGGAARARAAAQTAADAAALAGAAEGRAGAEDLARSNQGELISFREIDADVIVEVEVAGVRAKARARGSAAAGGVAGSATGLAPGLRAAVARAEALLGRRIPITSGFRSAAQQRALWERRGSNPYPVAPPGSSMHERGLAIDVPSSFVGQLLTVARQAGLCQPYPRNDPVHFELCR